MERINQICRSIVDYDRILLLFLGIVRNYFSWKLFRDHYEQSIKKICISVVRIVSRELS